MFANELSRDTSFIYNKTTYINFPINIAYIKDVFIKCLPNHMPINGRLYVNASLVAKLTQSNFVLKVCEGDYNLYQIMLFPETPNLVLYGSGVNTRLELDINPDAVGSGEIKWYTLYSKIAPDASKTVVKNSDLPCIESPLILRTYFECCAARIIGVGVDISSSEILGYVNRVLLIIKKYISAPHEFDITFQGISIMTYYKSSIELLSDEETEKIADPQFYNVYNLHYSTSPIKTCGSDYRRDIQLSAKFTSTVNPRDTRFIVESASSCEKDSDSVIYTPEGDVLYTNINAYLLHALQ
jgi:hypothetical protein